jgi:hypothetical protein
VGDAKHRDCCCFEEIVHSMQGSWGLYIYLDTNIVTLVANNIFVGFGMGGTRNGSDT